MSPRSDRLAAEEPLEIRVDDGTDTRTAAVTMRTPGNDFELAAGFLLGEGVIRDSAAVRRIDYCSDIEGEQLYNVVTVHLDAGAPVDLTPLDRHFITSSACGVCGKTSIDAIETQGIEAIDDPVVIDAAVLARLPETLRARQRLFATTGGLHAAGAFTAAGELVWVREDVGRHNALDKVIGRALLDRHVPLTATILLVSGRASFEIVQKAAVAGAPVVCAVSAPTDLAVATAERFGITLIGFLRGAHFNVYTRRERVRIADG